LHGQRLCYGFADSSGNGSGILSQSIELYGQQFAQAAEAAPAREALG